MKYNPKIHHRKSIRKKGYDYAQKGLYFITINCYRRACLFGEIHQGKMILNEAGNIAQTCWLEIPQHFPNVVLHEFVIMPNHVHGIIEITSVAKSNGDTLDEDTVDGAAVDGAHVRANDYSPLQVPTPVPIPESLPEPMHTPVSIPGGAHPATFRSPSKTIGSMVRGFKIGVTKWMRQHTSIHSVWQHNYHEHIIRSNLAYYRISRYIRENPGNW